MTDEQAAGRVATFSDEELWMLRLVVKAAPEKYPYTVFLIAQIDALTEALSASEEWRRAYKKGKYALCEYGGEIQDAAMKELPANEGWLDQVKELTIELPRLQQRDRRIAELEAAITAYEQRQIPFERAVAAIQAMLPILWSDHGAEKVKDSELLMELRQAVLDIPNPPAPVIMEIAMSMANTTRQQAREEIISELTAYAGRPIPEAADLDEKRDIRYRRKGVRDAIGWLWERGRAEAA